MFETIGFAKVSTSGPDARRLGYLRDGDAITMNRERLIADAKAHALQLAPTATRRRGRGRRFASAARPCSRALKLGVHLAWRAGRISDHDALIGRKLAWILAGGNLAACRRRVTEQHLLDLEREAFLACAASARRWSASQHTLKTGKPLRN